MIYFLRGGITSCFLVFSILAFGLTAGDITVTNGTGSYFFADDGNCGSSEVPTAAYLTVNVQNNSSDTLWSVQVKLTSISNQVDGFNLLNTQDDSTISISRILPGEIQGAYFYIEFPCQKNKSCNFDFVLSDANSGTVNYQAAMSTLDIQPASAGGRILDQNIVGLDVIGILIADTVTYEFGNYNGGHMVFQPSGDPNFPADNLELIGNKVVESAFSSCGLPVGTVNTMYINDASGCGAGSGNIVKVVFYYINSLYNDSTAIKPYAAMRSGGPTKYSNNYGSNGTEVDTFGTSIESNKVSMFKDGSCGICQTGDTLTMTIGVINNSSKAIMFDYITDSIPDGFKFLGFAPESDITAENTSEQPQLLDSGLLTFTGKVPETTFPYRSYVIDPYDTVQLVYYIELPSSGSNDVYDLSSVTTVGGFSLDTTSYTTCVGCSALPVKLIYFKGRMITHGVSLEWLTATEVNNQGFDLYRSDQEGNFNWLAFIDGSGNSNSLNLYQYSDDKMQLKDQPSVVYRLVQRDFDGGSEEFHTVVNLDRVNSNNKVNVFPNPVPGDYITIENVNLPSGEMKIYTLSGQLVLQSTFETVAGLTTLSGLSSLDTGIYLLEISSGNHVERVRLIRP
jgi:hypothetical protein